MGHDDDEIDSAFDEQRYHPELRSPVPNLLARTAS